MGCVKITLLVTYAFNAIMPLSRASTRGRYSRIEGVTVMASSRRSPGSGHGVGVMLAQVAL